MSVDLYLWDASNALRTQARVQEDSVWPKLKAHIHCVQTCDDLEDEESLKHLYHIMKGAIMLNSNRKLQAMLCTLPDAFKSSHALYLQPVALIAFVCGR